MAVLGPTASGKSGLAELLATNRKGELINADASALYRDLEVGVTKPDRVTRLQLPYHLLDVADLSQTVTVIDYQHMAMATLGQIAARDGLPILVGGSSLYVRALLEGYCPPDIAVPDEVRQRVRGLPLHEAVAALQQRDPAFLARLDRHNPRRVGRALELVLAHGGPVSEPTAKPLPGWEVLRLLLWPEKSVLEARIRRRTEEMWQAWLEEVLVLEKNALLPWLELRKPIGYGSVAAHLQGRLTRAEAIEEIVRATCLLAKKQRTWLQKETEGPDRHQWLLASEADWEKLPDLALAVLESFLARFTE